MTRPRFRSLLSAALFALIPATYAHAADIEPVEAGDPGWAHCNNQGMLDRCFKLKLDGGQRATITEADFALPKQGSRLAVTERKAPFTVNVEDGAIQLSVPDTYVWATVPLRTGDGERILLSVYSDRAAARKALTIWERHQENQEALREKASKRKKDDIDLLDDPFFAERADIAPSPGDEIIVYSGSGHGTGNDDWSFILDAKADSVLAQHPRSFLAFRVVRVPSDTDSSTLHLADATLGCAATEGSFRLWRLSSNNTLDVSLDIDTLDDMFGIPDGWYQRAKKRKSKRPKIWVTVDVDSDGTLDGINLFGAPERCENGREGYQIFWRNGTPRGKKL